MWERYGFYVIQSLLALFLTLQLDLSNSKTYSIVGTFTALSYIMPILGGYISDQLLGQKMAVIFGCVTLFISYFYLSFFFNSPTTLAISLGGIAIGTGLLKPNIACLVGNLYESGDSRRDGGFSIYYAGMALGILIGTTIPILLKHAYGWQLTFFTPGIALVVALFIFLFGIKKFKIKNSNPISLNLPKLVNAAFLSIIAWVSAFILLDYPFAAFLFFLIIAIGSVFIVTGIAMKEKKVQRAKTFSFLILCFISVLFWMLYFQLFLSLTLFIYHCLKTHLWGLHMHPTYYIAIESLGLVLFGPLLSPVFSKFALRQDAIDASVKFILSIFFLVIAFLLVILSIIFTHKTALISPLWIIFAYLSVSFAELLLSPVGLSMSTKLVRPQVVGLMMGIFFVSLGVGGYLAGLLAQLSSVPKNTSYIEMKSIYLTAFSYYFYIALGILALTIILCLLIRKINLSAVASASFDT